MQQGGGGQGGNNPPGGWPGQPPQPGGAPPQGAPQQPQAPYGAPQQPYAAPQQPYAPPQQPQQPYAAPQQQYAAPQQQYAAPQQPYAAPQQQYAAPQQPYAAPQQQYAAPQQPYAAPQQPYGAPQQPYAGQQQPYGAPHQQPYGAPQPPPYPPQPPQAPGYGAPGQAAPAPAPTGPIEPIPWEQRAQLGTVTAFIKTVERMFKPQAFFDAVAVNDDPTHAVKFGVACWVVGAVARAVFGFVFGGILEIGFFGGHYGSFTGDLIWLGWQLVIAALMGFIAVHLYAAIEHAVLEGQKGATRPKSATLKVAGYSGVAGLLFFAPGHLGNLVWVATLLLNMIGLQRVHRADQTKALLSALAASFAIGLLYVVVFGVIASILILSVLAAIGFAAR